jgi:four helix bundle protein
MNRNLGRSPETNPPTRSRPVEPRFNLEERLLVFASNIIELSERLPPTRSAQHVAGQLLRSGTSPYANHGEAQDAESRDDFVHKMKLCLKELREAGRWLLLIRRMGWRAEAPCVDSMLDECSQLLRIFKSSVTTAQKNRTVSRRIDSGSD